MDQKGKRGLSRDRENSWGDINLHTAPKPGVTDLRPSFYKVDQPPLTISSERQYQPSKDLSLMLQSYSSDYLAESSAPSSATKAKTPCKESRYMPPKQPHKANDKEHITHNTTLSLVHLALMQQQIDSTRYTQLYTLLIALIRMDSALFRYTLVNDMHSAEMLLAQNNMLIMPQLQAPHVISYIVNRCECDAIEPFMRHESDFDCNNNGESKALVSRHSYVETSPTRQGKEETLIEIIEDDSLDLLSFPMIRPPIMCDSCWLQLNRHWSDYSLSRYLAATRIIINGTGNGEKPLDLGKGCQICEVCVSLITTAWLNNDPCLHLYKLLPCAYTLTKLKILQRYQHYQHSNSEIPCEKRKGVVRCTSIYVPKPSSAHSIANNQHHMNHMGPYTITRHHHDDYLTRWQDALHAILTFAAHVCASIVESGRLRRAGVVMEERGHPRKTPTDAQLVDSWLSGGTFGSRAAVLVFRSSALAQSSDASIAGKPGSRLHITFRVVQAETKLLAKLLECHGIVEATMDSNDFNLLWTGSHPKPGILRSMAPHQRVNHFPRSYELTRKDRLYKNIEKMQHAKGLKHFDFIPQTFLMPTEYRELCTTHHRVKGPWIVKPAASSRGRGIYIVESPNQVPIEEPVVVAKYISKPLLIKGHKCDLRLYVAVTSFDPLLIYIYEEGMVRFATVKYDTTHKQLWNPCMHLCNYSINKYHSDYVKSDDPSAENVGHKWTLSALLRHLKSIGKDTAHLMTQVEDLVIKAILACGNSIITACKMFVPNAYNCFELYGFDILIDENLKPWLLEVNLSPSLGCDSPLDVRLKSAMLADLLTLVGIPAVDPMIKPTSPASTASTKSLKMKLSNCRRIHSAEGLSNHTLPKKSSKGSISVSNSSLTAEDNKMVKSAKGQFMRRGGFVRIFPAVDSWAKYAQYLDPVSGIPIAGSSTSIPFSFMGQHNNNQILYRMLYPEMVVPPAVVRPDKHSRQYVESRRRECSLETVRRSEGPVSTPRQDRYERKLSQGHRSTLSAPKKPQRENYSAELKKQVCDMVKNGKKLSQVEARKAFSQYLMCVLKRISTSADQDGHIEIVLKFLQKASTYLKNPFYVKIPSHKLSEKDRAAIVAKQLNDFLYLYNRETDLYADLDRPSQIPKNVFNEFLEHSSENDLEELLILQNIHMVPSDPSAPTFQGLLHSLPSINSICFSSPEAAKKPVKVTPLS